MNNNYARALNIIERALRRVGQDIDAARGFSERFAAECKYLLATGRYGWLLREFRRLKTKEKFKSVALEVHFAYGFESAGIPLRHEVQSPEVPGTVDYAAVLSEDVRANFELVRHGDERWKRISPLADEAASTQRLRNLIRDKCVRHGRPHKFPPAADGVYNVIVVDASRALGGWADGYHYSMVCYGAQTVPSPLRLPVVGIWQLSEEVPEEFAAQCRYHNVPRERIHAVVFARDKGILGGQGMALYAEYEYEICGNPWLVREDKRRCLCDLLLPWYKPEDEEPQDV